MSQAANAKFACPPSAGPSRRPLRCLAVGFAVLAILFQAGCSSGAVDKSDTINFATKGDRGLFYAVYEDPDAVPSFEDRFRVYVDGEYIGDMGPDDVIDTPLLAGEHVFEIRIYAWYGNLVKDVHVKKSVVAFPNFVSLRINSKSAKLINVDRVQGEHETEGRKRICGC